MREISAKAKFALPSQRDKVSRVVKRAEKFDKIRERCLNRKQIVNLIILRIIQIFFDSVEFDMIIDRTNYLFVKLTKLLFIKLHLLNY